MEQHDVQELCLSAGEFTTTGQLVEQLDAKKNYIGSIMKHCLRQDDVKIGTWWKHCLEDSSFYH